jgi:hypothetical protein
LLPSAEKNEYLTNAAASSLAETEMLEARSELSFEEYLRRQSAAT